MFLLQIEESQDARADGSSSFLCDRESSDLPVLMRMPYGRLRRRMPVSSDTAVGVSRTPRQKEAPMKVQAIMTSSPFFATRYATISEIAKIMADHEIGVVPIVNGAHHVVGILTDRDLCKAIATMNRPASEIAALGLASKPVISCGPEEELESALKTMRHHRIRRLPVVDKDGRLQGILSIDDVVLRSEEAMETSHSAISFGDTVRTLKAIYGERAPRRPRVIST
jgi:CBS domain-containing protein